MRAALVFCSPILIAIIVSYIFVNKPSIDKSKIVNQQSTIVNRKSKIDYNSTKDSIITVLLSQKPLQIKRAIEGNCKTIIIQYSNNYKITIQRCQCTEQPQGCWNYFLLHNKELIPIQSDCGVVGNMVRNETYKNLRTRFMKFD